MDRSDKIQISHSKIQLYDECGWKFKLQHIDKWQVDKTFTALHFGSAIDEALNYVLEQFKQKLEISSSKAKELFTNKMNSWNGQNDLEYFKNDCPKENINGTPFEELSHKDKQFAVFYHLIEIGYKIIEVYIEEILNKFESIDRVQCKHNIKNSEGDLLIIVLDFIATLKDGRKVVFDNKTSSDIKKYYGPSSVKNSNQLALYTEYYPNYYSGYIALGKKLVRGKIPWTMVVDKIDETKIEDVFNNIEIKTQMIKDGIFEKNNKSCWNFGRRCPYYDLCYNGNNEGLIQKNNKT